MTTAASAGALEVAPRVREVYEAAIDSILLKREIASVEFKDLKLRELLPGDEAKARNPIERAILSQSLKLIWVTLEVLEQEEEAELAGVEPAASRPAPRPFIPGTTGEKEWGP